MNFKNLYALPLCLFTVLLSACGGGSGTGSATRGIEGSGISPDRITSAGAITDKGSIFVNGVEYGLNFATITIDGDPGTEADLDVGGIAIVEGNINPNGTTGTATRVTAGIAVAGPVSAVDLALQRITVLGQSVVVDAATRIVSGVDGQILGGLKVGDDVEVAGFADSSGAWFARRIAPRNASTPLRVKGYAGDVDAAHRRFVINGQIVDYSAATLTGFSGRALAGAPVRVDADNIDADGDLRATEVVYRAPGLPGNTGDIAVLQGWVTRFASAADFDVDGHPVVTTSATKVSGAANDIVSVIRLDAFIEVKGKLVANGVVQASEILTNNLISMDAVVWGKDGQSFYTNLWRLGASACNTTAGTSISIDGVPSTFDALQVGDVATIYEHNDHVTKGVTFEDDGNCEIVAVEHNVRGPLESKPTDSLSFRVMGQRIWIDPRMDASIGTVDGTQTGFNTLASLKVGDIVEVSGHTTAEGDILATGIHAGAATGPYRVIGLAREVDSTLEQFQLGNLTVNYHDAGLAGFAANGPAERDRVLVVADTLPSGGVLQADIVRYTGDLPRGAFMNFLRYNGLVTRYAAADDFDVEGRRLVPADPQWGDPTEGHRCDMSKAHANLSSMYMLGLGWGPGQLAHFGYATCPPGRTLNNQGRSGWFGNASINIGGNVQSIDQDNLVIRVGGIDIPLQPATRITHFEPKVDLSIGDLTPMQLDEVRVGDRVGVLIESIAGRRAGIEVWHGDGAVPAGDLVIKTGLESAAEPELVLYSGIRVHVTADTVFEKVQCERLDNVGAEEFWVSVDRMFSIEVGAVPSGSEFVARRIKWNSGCGVDAGPDQVVKAGMQVHLDGNYTSFDADSSWQILWKQIAGPEVVLEDAGSLSNVSFVAPQVSEPVDLIFEYSLTVDGVVARDMVTIHVLPAE